MLFARISRFEIVDFTIVFGQANEISLPNPIQGGVSQRYFSMNTIREASLLPDLLPGLDTRWYARV
jgi:hypothetical protein